MAPSQPPQPLTAKESSLFRTVIRNYEDKQYKKGLKAAEQILKKRPNHGDTLAMKALIINAQGKTDEAFALGKIALQNDMKSHICWHVYGILYRSNKNFEEAVKAYKFALKLEPESQQIQRDLALIQIQMRDYQGYVASRRAMLKARSQVRQSWTALAVALHLAGDLAEAENVLTTYEDTLKNPPLKTDFENSEAVMYKNSIIAETGDIQRALDHLEAVGKTNLDRLAVMESRAEYLTKLGRKEEAAKAYRALLDRNAEHKAYYDGLVSVLDISPEDHKSRKEIYDAYAQKYPRSDAARRLPLDFLEGDAFREAAKAYVHRMLDKGVPSTFANLKHLYADEFKRDTLLSLAEEYLSEKKGVVNGETKREGDQSKGDSAALYFLAQHYNYHLSRDLAKAMQYVDQAIEKDPKNPDFMMTKARIWKHYGNPQKASETMEQARQLDVRDRHINTKTAKYQLRNNESENALKTVGLFTRAETVGGPLADLHDMQCMWYLTEDGESYARQGNVGLALKRFTSIYNIFDVWQEDQFDFHNFSLRKGQIRAYVQLIRWEDRLREHPMYTRAALGAVKLYLDLHDKPLLNGVNGANGHADDALEKKKAAKKAKKEAERAKEAAAKKTEPNKPVARDLDGQPKKEDDDPEGVKLASTTEPLKDAMKFLGPLLEFSPKNLESQLAGFEVYIRKEKLLLALRCLLAAASIDAENPRVHEQTIRFKQALDKASDSLPPQAKEVIDSEFRLLPASSSLAEVNSEFLAKNKDSPSHILYGTSAKRVLSSDDQLSQLDKNITSILDLPRISLEDAQEGLALLSRWRSAELATYKQKAAAKWAEASIFQATS